MSFSDWLEVSHTSTVRISFRTDAVADVKTTNLPPAKEGWEKHESKKFPGHFYECNLLNKKETEWLNRPSDEQFQQAKVLQKQKEVQEKQRKEREQRECEKKEKTKVIVFHKCNCLKLKGGGGGRHRQM